MTDASTFSYDRFMSLAGSELVRYAEPFVNTRIEAIPESVYDPLESTLDGMDEMHTVYALEICMLLRPREFVSRAVEFLSHSDASVCCAACRMIEKMPRNSMPAELATKIAVTPIVDLYGPDLHSDKRIRMGTNEQFIRDLVENSGQERRREK